MQERSPPLDLSVTEWRSAFDGIASPMAVVRTDGTVVHLNPAAASLAGSARNGLAGGRLSGLAPLEPWRSAAELIASIGDGPTMATVRDTASGITWEIAAYPSGKENLTPLVSLIMRDITDVVALQETLVRNQTMSALGQLVAGVAHEVRSPIFGISATIDAFEARFGQANDFGKYLENLRRELGRMNDLMRDLLELGRPVMMPRRPELAGLMLEEAVQSCRPLAQQRQVTLRSLLNPEDSGLRINADRRRLVQGFHHLLENALQHAPAGTEVTVTGSRQSRGRGWDLLLIVEDQGPGFRPEDLSRIGQPFFTRRAGGTGLGLAIVQRIIEDHSGTVAISNRPKGGASARITLPLDSVVNEDTA